MFADGSAEDFANVGAPVARRIRLRATSVTATKPHRLGSGFHAFVLADTWIPLQAATSRMDSSDERHDVITVEFNFEILKHPQHTSNLPLVSTSALPVACPSCLRYHLTPGANSMNGNRASMLNKRTEFSTTRERGNSPTASNASFRKMDSRSLNRVQARNLWGRGSAYSPLGCGDRSGELDQKHVWPGHEPQLPSHPL